MQDAQRTIALVREHAKEWEIDPKRVGILGFSAGGHLAAVTSTNFDNAAKVMKKSTRLTSKACVPISPC